jgi:hypothetical protein
MIEGSSIAGVSLRRILKVGQGLIVETGQSKRIGENRPVSAKV